MTGAVNFNSKSTLSDVEGEEEEYEYEDEKPAVNADIFKKENIDRRDSSIGSHHRPSDVNQLVPNFHDFLNLPVKYNSEKYVYPLISSSYANTKVQGNVNKQYNHKDYVVTTYKPTSSPTYYYTSSKPSYVKNDIIKTQKKEYHTNTASATSTSSTSSTPRPSSTTSSSIDKIYLTTKESNLMDTSMNHHEAYQTTDAKYHQDSRYTTHNNLNEIYLTTNKPPSTTTKRPMSLFEQLFGEYEEIDAAETAKPPSSASTESSMKNENNYYYTEKTTTTASTTTKTTSSESNVLTGSNMAHGAASYEYEYEDEVEDNIAVENKRTESAVKSIETTTKSIATPQQTSEKPVNHNNYNLTQNETKPVFENADYNEYDYINEKENVTSKPSLSSSSSSSSPSLITESPSTVKVTSLPLGENHVTNRNPIMIGAQNLREKLNSEKVAPQTFDFSKPIMQHPPSTSNIHIAHDQDTVSFVMGHHQNVEGGKYVGTAVKESPYGSNHFRPLYNQQPQQQQQQPTLSGTHSVSYHIQPQHSAQPAQTEKVPKFPAGSSVTIQPMKNSEASLAIGVPVNSVKQVPGQVMDEKLEINNDKTDFPKPSGQKVVFPTDDKQQSYVPDLVPPPKHVPPKQTPPKQPLPNREVLKLSSKPMFHQLPSDLTPPNEKDIPVPPSRGDRPRPPWDPRPGHFYSGRPEYARPPRPPPGSELTYKRIDNLPNILPQFRPNMKVPNAPHYFENANKGYARQPLLERPSNRPVGFFEKLHPPPPPKHLQNLRKIPALEQEAKKKQAGPEERIQVEPLKKPPTEQFTFYQTPPKIMLPNRRSGNEEPEVETLQMIQAKQAEKQEVSKEATFASEKDDVTDKPLYVVYPVNTAPLKLDAIDTNKKEAVVIGTRAELPLPPSKINNKDFNYEQDPILSPKDRHDAPILKPHLKPNNFPAKSDFPYPLERPDPSVLNPPVPETHSGNENALDAAGDENNNSVQWNDAQSRIVTGSKINTQSSNQISVTLKTYTERPIAVAYTPTEPHDKFVDKYSMPNYASPVIPEIRPGSISNVEIGYEKPNSEFTLSAVMHTRPRPELQQNPAIFKHKIDTSIDTTHVPAQEFQAPFQASVNIVDSSVSQGWSVVRDKSKSEGEHDVEVTTLPLATTSEFDIENFKPQLIGGFVPIYSYPEDGAKRKETEVKERQEKTIL